MDVPPAVSLICTVRDEADTIAALLDSMLAQSRPADEIVVNDCQSRDATPAIVEGYIAAGQPIRLVRGGYNIPSGRNNAIRHARGDLIACTDAGLTLDRHWLERILAPLEHGRADVVGGFFQPAPHNLFEQTLAATNYRDAPEIDPARFLPFGQSVAFRKSAWERVGGYPEWASHCEDILFDRALQRAGYRFAFVPDALVLFRPRDSLGAFARQYFLYARGDGVANLWPLRHAIRYGTYLAAGLLLGLAIRRRRPALLLGLAPGILGYIRAPLRRLRTRAPVLAPSTLAAAALLVPVIRVVGDLAKMAGYPVGVLRRLFSPALRREIAQYTQNNANALGAERD
jgi:glycosyltransferase involved in cell wall biosynthesis